MTTIYTNLYEISELEKTIIRYIIDWIKEKKEPISQVKIVKEMESRGMKHSTIIYSLNGLLKLGYIRRAVVTPYNKTKYVLLRTI